MVRKTIFSLLIILVVIIFTNSKNIASASAEEAVVKEKTYPGIVGVIEYDTDNRFRLIVEDLKNHGVQGITFEVLNDGGVKVVFLLHPVIKEKK